jgi:hypothetical protein
VECGMGLHGLPRRAVADIRVVPEP